jgi:hypothetical protein
MEKSRTEEGKRKLNGDYNGFNKLYRTVSLELIGGLLCVLMMILIGVISWNYVSDSDARMASATGIAKLQAEKIDRGELEPLREDIHRLRQKHDQDVNRIVDKLDESVQEIKRIVMKKYMDDG